VAKKNLMGEAGRSIFRGSGADALALAAGVEAEPEEKSLEPSPTSSAAPAAPPTPAPAPTAPALAPAADGAELTVTTFRITRDQHEALRVAAVRRARASGGRADASVVLRELLAEWMARGAT
jgi:hypothetical protein